MATKRIKTPWDAEIKELEDAKDYAIPIIELKNPEGLCELSFIAEGYRRGAAETEAHYAELIAAAEAIDYLWGSGADFFPAKAYRALAAALDKVKGAD